MSKQFLYNAGILVSFLKISPFFILRRSMIFFLIPLFHFFFFENWLVLMDRALKLLTFSDFPCLHVQNGTDGNQDSG